MRVHHTDRWVIWSFLSTISCILNFEFWILNSEFWILNFEFWILNSNFEWSFSAFVYQASGDLVHGTPVQRKYTLTYLYVNCSIILNLFSNDVFIGNDWNKCIALIKSSTIYDLSSYRFILWPCDLVTMSHSRANEKVHWK